MPEYGTVVDGLVVALVGIFLLAAGLCSCLREWYGLPARGDAED